MAMKARISPAMELRYQEQLRRSESTVARQWRSYDEHSSGVAKNRYDPQRQSNGRADTQRHSGPEQRQSAAMIRNGGKEPIGKGKASTGLTRQRRGQSKHRYATARLRSAGDGFATTARMGEGYATHRTAKA